jgi:hypothetical protein
VLVVSKIEVGVEDSVTIVDDYHSESDGEPELIHKSDVYFDFFQPELIKERLSPRFTQQLRHGDVYIYLNQLILHERGRWFRVQVSDIVNIKVIPEDNQIITRVGWFDLVICCGNEGQLLAIKNFLELIRNYANEHEKNATKIRIRTVVNGNQHYKKLKVKLPDLHHT